MIAANDNAPLRFLSVCSGIEAASVAWNPLGWEAVAFSEIEKFPSAVLAHHYPDVPNLGDFTKINPKTLGRVDIFCGGTPCQAFSVAGLRNSLGDARGNLSLEFVRLAHELAGGNGLRNVVWENVPGVLNTKDNAFGCFLGGLVGAGAAVPPPNGTRWPRAGLVSGPKGRAAWGILDAQHFGLAQRRKRVIVVADFGNGADPAAVLFELASLRGYSPQSRKAGEGVAGTVTGGSRKGGGYSTDDIPLTAAFGGNNTSGPIDVATAVNAHGGPCGRMDFESETFVLRGHSDYGPGMPSLRAEGGDAGGGSEVICVTGDITHTLKAEGADASEDGTGRGTPIIACADVTNTLTSHGDAHTGFRDENGLVAALTVSIRGRDGGATAEIGGEVATALRASQGGGDKPHVLTSAVRRLTPVECERLQGFPDGYTLIPFGSKKKIQARELLYLRITKPWLSMEEARQLASDGPRYKALGNSWAVPKFRWIGERIARLMPKTAANDNLQAAVKKDAA